MIEPADDERLSSELDSEKVRPRALIHLNH